MRIAFLTIILCCVSFAQANYTVKVSEQVIEEADERKARREAIDKATDDVTVEMVKLAIGESRYRENVAKVKSEVQPLKNRFIPFFKIISSQQEGESHRFKIEVKVSEKDLRLVLQQKGLFASLSKTGITLPFIEFNNQLNGETYRWWSTSFGLNQDLKNLALVFEKEMFQGFLEQGLFLLRPQAFNMSHMLPDFLQKTYLTQTEMVQITSLKQGQLFVEGRVDVISSPVRDNAFRVRVDLKCRQASNGKLVAEVVRTMDSSAGKQLNQLGTDIEKTAEESGRDLAAQVYDLWQRGALEAEVLKLAVTGDLNHMQLIRFKNALQEALGVRDITERLFEPGRVTFEMDYTGGSESLVRKLKTTRFDGFLSQVVSSQPDEIILDVKAQ